MAAKYDVYKCEDCSTLLMVLDIDGCDFMCGEKKMVKVPEQTADAATEKHVPIIEKIDSGYKVSVGSTFHPMLEKHWIQWIELVVDGTRMMKELNPGDEPVAYFCSDIKTPKQVSAREYCNIHGLWKGEL